ncbi:cytidine/deoxycytidylate deaminase family protein [Sesbania bispinosa]|nr:cytidine/deoxycytidylate deaminase family protein [Sesbania bispinosa]
MHNFLSWNNQYLTGKGSLLANDGGSISAIASGEGSSQMVSNASPTTEDEMEALRTEACNTHGGGHK